MCCLTGVSARTARVLVLMVIPGQIIFILLIYVIEPHKKSVDITPLFAVIYITAAIIQVLIYWPLVSIGTRSSVLVGHYIFALWFLLLAFFLPSFLSSPNLSC